MTLNIKNELLILNLLKPVKNTNNSSIVDINKTPIKFESTPSNNTINRPGISTIPFKNNVASTLLVFNCIVWFNLFVSIEFNEDPLRARILIQNNKISIILHYAYQNEVIN